MTRLRRVLASYGRRALASAEERESAWLRLQLERARTLYGALLQARTLTATPGYPVALADLENVLRRLGLERGDTVYVHSSLERLYRGSAVPTPEQSLGRMRYALAVVDLLVELVGPEGTIVMNTDGVQHADVFRAWADQVPPDEPIFDYRKTPSRRGLVSELFRRRDGAVRSVHPWYNMTAVGARAEELLRDDVQSTPYAMDVHSSTYKLTVSGGKVALLGSGLDVNVPLHLVDYVHPDEFPRPVYVNRPIRMTYVARDGSVEAIDVMLHSPYFYVQSESTRSFCTYLNEKYSLYRLHRFDGGAEVAVFDALRQYEASVAEMRAGVTWYDPRFLAD